MSLQGLASRSWDLEPCTDSYVVVEGTTSALLFPIDWPEPFGLVMIEAMACGTGAFSRSGSLRGEWPKTT